MPRKLLAAPIALLAFFLIFTRPVHAYIDPATTTYIVQIISALIITASVTIGVYFSRIRIFFLNFRTRMTAFWIHISSGKENRVQRPIQEVHWPSLLWRDSRPYPRRFLLAAVPALVLSLTLFVFGVFELYASNLDSFAFSIYRLLLLFFLIASLGALLLSVLLAFMRGLVFDILVSLLAGTLLAGYIQSNWLNTSLGKLTGDVIAWEAFQGQMLGNLLFWIVIFVLVVALRFFSKKGWTFFLRVLPLLLAAVQLTSSLVLVARDPRLRTPASNSYLSDESIYQMADGQNIIVIVLDRLDNRFIEEVLADSPGFFAPLDGFTRFTNNTSPYSQTFPAVTELLTAEPYDYAENMNSYMKRAWREGNYLPRFKEAGFSLDLFLTPTQSYAQASDLAGIADNLAYGGIGLRQGAALSRFSELASYRFLPLALKPFFWTSTDQFDSLVTATKDSSPYRINDFEFYRGLREDGLTLTGVERRFCFLHLNGPHAPYNMDDKGREVEAGQSSSLLQTKGNFHILYEFIGQLKDLELYEDATIIITGDHGARQTDTRPLERPIVTGLFVKPSGRAGQPLEINEAAVSSDNLRPFLLEEAGLKDNLGEPGYFEVSPHAFIVRYLYHRLYASEGQSARLLTYQILDDANNFDNWILVEEEEIK